MQNWAWLILLGGSGVHGWAYADFQFWRRDVRVTPNDASSLLFGQVIRCFPWSDIGSITIVDDYNTDRMRRETRCKLQSGSKAIGFKDFIEDYPALMAVVEEKARELSIPLTHEDRSGKEARTLRKP